jgi:hypothetical protein
LGCCGLIFKALVFKKRGKMGSIADIAKKFSGSKILSASDKNRSGTLPVELSEHRNPSSKNASRFLFSRANSHIEFWVNPRECIWHIATRTAIEKIQGGAVHHEWVQSGTNRNASFTYSRYDQPTVSFSFQSGCINLNSYKDISLKNFSYPLTISPGVGNFYDFIQLLEETNMNGDGSPNYVTITYSSPTFGKRGIILEGYFTDEGITWTETAEQPNQISNWGATFMVFNCTPSLSELRGNWENPDVFI